MFRVLQVSLNPTIWRSQSHPRGLMMNLGLRSMVVESAPSLPLSVWSSFNPRVVTTGASWRLPKSEVLAAHVQGSAPRWQWAFCTPSHLIVHGLQAFPASIAARARVWSVAHQLRSSRRNRGRSRGSPAGHAITVSTPRLWSSCHRGKRGSATHLCSRCNP